MRDFFCGRHLRNQCMACTLKKLNVDLNILYTFIIIFLKSTLYHIWMKLDTKTFIFIMHIVQDIDIMVPNLNQATIPFCCLHKLRNLTLISYSITNLYVPNTLESVVSMICILIYNLWFIWQVLNAHTKVTKLLENINHTHEIIEPI